MKTFAREQVAAKGAYCVGATAWLRSKGVRTYAEHVQLPEAEVTVDPESRLGARLDEFRLECIADGLAG